MSLQLYPFQKDGVRFMIQSNGNFIMASDTGTGKTAQSLTYADMYADKLRPMLILCPASLKYNWEKEANMWLTKKEKITIIDEAHNISIEKKVRNSDIVIVNYDRLFNRKGNKDKKAWSDVFSTCGYRFMICDESQNIKNPFSSRTKAVLQIAKTVPHIGVLSATPVENSPADYWVSLNLIAPHRFPNYHEFARTYSKPDIKYGSVSYKGGRNLLELHEKTKQYVIRHLKSEVLKDLPERIKSCIPVNLSSYSEYNREYKSFEAIKTKIRQGKATKFNALTELTKLRKEIALNKFKDICDYIDNFLESNNEKIIVFGYHKELLAKLEERYKEQCVIITGDVSAKKRQQAVDSFQNDSKCRIFFSNIISGGAGLTLTAGAYMLFVELLYNPAKMYQALDRNYRIGQKKKCFVYYMIARNTIEEKMMKILDEKANIASQVMDGTELGDNELLEMLLEAA